VLLVALVVVGLLGHTLMRQMGLFGGDTPGTHTVAAPAHVPAEVSAAPMQALERAKGVEQQVLQQARDSAARIDKATQ